MAHSLEGEPKKQELVKNKKYYHLYKKNVVQEPKNEVGGIS